MFPAAKAHAPALAPEGHGGRGCFHCGGGDRHRLFLGRRLARLGRSGRRRLGRRRRELELFGDHGGRRRALCQLRGGRRRDGRQGRRGRHSPRPDLSDRRRLGNLKAPVAVAPPGGRQYQQGNQQAQHCNPAAIADPRTQRRRRRRQFIDSPRWHPRLGGGSDRGCRRCAQQQGGFAATHCGGRRLRPGLRDLASAALAEFGCVSIFGAAGAAQHRHARGLLK